MNRARFEKKVKKRQKIVTFEMNLSFPFNIEQ